MSRTSTLRYGERRVVGSGGTQNVYGSSVNTVLGSGGVFNAEFGGTATGTVVSKRRHRAMPD